MEADTEAIGNVVRGRFGANSKSDHEAIWLDCGHTRYVLRRPDGNPISDPELIALAGKRIRARGFVIDYTFVLTDWDVLTDGKRSGLLSI